MSRPGGRTPWRRRTAVARAGVAAAAVAVALGGIGSTAPASAADGPVAVTGGPTVLFAGHTDAVSVHLVDGAFEVGVKDDTMEPTVEYRDPEEVLLQVLPSAELVVPEDLDPSVYAVTGPPGSRVWLLDQVQQPGLLWPGFETGGVPVGSVVDDEIHVDLTAVAGPGVARLFDTDLFGFPVPVWDSGDGLPDTLTLRTSTHSHLGWVFTEPGAYTLTVEVTAEDVDGGTVTSGEVDYRFFVGATDDLPGEWGATRAVRALYQGVLDRRPDAGGSAYWSGRLASGGSVEALAATLARTAEGRATTVRRTYQRTLGRSPSGPDIAFWSDQLRRIGPEALRARLLAAPEVLAAAGDVDGWVRRVLWTALEREPEEGAVAYWAGRVQGWGGAWAGREKVARTVLRSAEARAVDVRYGMQEVCHRDLWGQPVPADLLASHLATGLDVGRLRAAIAAGDCAPTGTAGTDARTTFSTEES